MLRDILVDSFNILKNNLIIIQPFIFFLLVISLFISPLSMKNGFSPAMIVFMISIFALICAFFAGWFQMFQAAIRNFRKDIKEEEKPFMSFAILKEFFPAVGRFFVPISIAIVLYCVLLYFVFKLTAFLGVHFIGIPDSFRVDNLLQIFADEKKAYEFISALSEADKIKISQWNILTLFATGAYSYLTMFWFPAIIMNGENAIKGLITNFKAIFSNPVVTFGIFIPFWLFMMFVPGIISAIFSNFIIQLFNLMFMIFIMNYYMMAVFVYFEDFSEDSIARWTNSFR